MGVVVLSGIPGAGKSHVAKWLVEANGYRHIDVDYCEDPVIHELLSHQDAAALATELKSRRPVVLDWGFPVGFLPLIEALAERGASIWWFDGDRGVLSDRYRQRENYNPQAEAALQKQLREIASVWSSIAKAFDGQMIDVLDEAGLPRNPEQLWAEMSRPD